MRSTRATIGFLLIFAACRQPPRQEQPSCRNDWPSIPKDLNLPETNLLILPSPQDTAVVYYRNLAMVAFDDTVSGTAIRAFFERYRAVVIGGADYVGLCGGYILQIPDPGSTWVALDSVLTKMEHEPGVAEVMDLTYRDRMGPL